MIAIRIDKQKSRLVLTMSGWLTVSEIEAFDRDRTAALATMGVRTGEYDLLVLTLGNVIQPQDVIQAFAAIVTSSPLKARRIATVRGGVLTRMQSRRLGRLRSGSEVFETQAEAEEWLASPMVDAAP